MDELLMTSRYAAAPGPFGASGHPYGVPSQPFGPRVTPAGLLLGLSGFRLPLWDSLFALRATGHACGNLSRRFGFQLKLPMLLCMSKI